jgi:sugar (pentulose or hexulose) kinase
MTVTMDWVLRMMPELAGAPRRVRVVGGAGGVPLVVAVVLHAAHTTAVVGGPGFGSAAMGAAMLAAVAA